MEDASFTFLDYPEPNEISYLNFDPIVSRHAQNLDFLENFTIMISLENKIVVQKRVVYDFLTMLSDVGGLNDFLVLFFATIFGFFSE